MNKLKFLNKLRKRHLDRERKKRLKEYIKKANKCYVKGIILELYVANEMDYNIFNESIRVDFGIYNYIIKYLNNLNIKYEITTEPLYNQKEEPFVAKIKFIYEEGLNE